MEPHGGTRRRSDSQDVAAAGRVVARRDHRDRRRRPGPARPRRGHGVPARPRPRRGAHTASIAVAEVHQQLAVLPRHDVGPRDGLEPAVRRSAATISGAGSSMPCGKRPTSRMPGRRVALLRPRRRARGGSRAASRTRRTSSRTGAGPRRSLETPFCTETTGVSGGAWAGEVLEGGSGLVGLHAQQDHGVRGPGASAARPDGRHVEDSSPSAVSSRSPCSRMRARCSPRATRVAACPLRCRWAPTTPPTAPAP